MTLHGRALGIIVALAAMVSCGGTAAHESTTPKARPRPPHAQIFRALTTPQRGKIADEFRARNGVLWRVGGEEEGRGAADVDRFRGFIRRAFRRDPAKSDPNNLPTEEEAALVAQAFVKKNADLLGIPARELVDLETKALPLSAAVQPTPQTHWMARVAGMFPTRGYEAFKDVESSVDVWIYVDDDRETRFFANFSHVHGGLGIDTRVTTSDDVIASKLVGRRLFALVDEGGPPVSVRALRRLSLGTIEAADVKRRDLVIHVSEGPMQAWLVYRLAFKVQIEKKDASGAFFYFFYVVDADSGDVIEDAAPPIVPPIP